MGLSKGRRLTIQRIFEKCIKERNGIWTVQRGQDIRKIQNRHATKSGEEEGEKEGSIEEKVIEKEECVEEKDCFEKEIVKKESGNKEEDCDKEKESFKEKDCVQKEDGFKEKGCLEEEDRIEKENGIEEEDWQQQEEVNTMDLTIRMRARHRKKGEKMIFICTHLFFYSYYHQFNFIIP